MKIRKRKNKQTKNPTKAKPNQKIEKKKNNPTTKQKIPKETELQTKSDNLKLPENLAKIYGIFKMSYRKITSTWEKYEGKYRSQNQITTYR